MPAGRDSQVMPPNSESERFLKMLQDASYIKKIHMLRPHHTETLLVF